MTTCGTSYHDERGEVQDCTPATPCRSCLVAEVERLREIVTDPDDVIADRKAVQVAVDILQRRRDQTSQRVVGCLQSALDYPSTEAATIPPGHVLVDARELEALRELFRASGDTIHASAEGSRVTLTAINEAWAGVCAAQICSTMGGG